MALDFQITYDARHASPLTWGESTTTSIMGLSGLWDLPDLRFSSLPRGQDHGTYEAGEFMNGRTITMRLGVRAGTRSALSSALEAIYARTTPGTTRELRFKTPNIPERFTAVRCRRRSTNLSIYGVGFATVDLEFYASNPRLYSVALKTTTIPVTNTNTPITNSGNFPATMICRFKPTTSQPDPELVSDSQNKAIRFIGNTIVAPDFYTVDTYERTVKGSTGISRYNQLTTFSLITIPPGTSNLRAVSPLGDGNVEVDHYDTWV